MHDGLLTPFLAIMLALVYSEQDKKLELVHNHPLPVPREGEALIKVLRAGVCSTVRVKKGTSRKLGSLVQACAPVLPERVHKLQHSVS